MKDFRFGILNEFYGSRLSERQREIIKNYYDFDFSLSEIADNCGITRQAVCDALKKGERTLSELERDMGFYEKMSSIKERLEELYGSMCKNGESEEKQKLSLILDMF